MHLFLCLTDIPKSDTMQKLNLFVNIMIQEYLKCISKDFVVEISEHNRDIVL